MALFAKWRVLTRVALLSVGVSQTFRVFATRALLPADAVSSGQFVVPTTDRVRAAFGPLYPSFR